MEWAAASLAVLAGVGSVGVSLQAVGIGCEVSGWIFLSWLTKTPINELTDVSAQSSFAAPDIAGLTRATMDPLLYWLIPHLGRIGAALAPPPSSAGAVAEEDVTLRAAPLNIVHRSPQARRLPRRLDAGWNAGPVFEGGLPVRL
jgi:hypothetical protein